MSRINSSTDSATSLIRTPSADRGIQAGRLAQVRSVQALLCILRC
jgi:hypothetical protein